MAAKVPPKRVYIVWCDGGWSAFTAQKTAAFWAEDDQIHIFEPAKKVHPCVSPSPPERQPK